MSAGEAGSVAEDARVPVRVFISYAHDDDAHVERVRNFWLFLRANGIDARLDLPAAEKRVAWAQWMTREVRDADRVLVIASPAYKKRAEGDAKPDEGRGVQFETWLVQEVFYTDQEAGLQRVIPVVLPGGSADDLPLWLAPVSTSCYRVREYTLAGADKLLRLLTDQPFETEPPLGKMPVLPPRGAGQPTVAARPVLRTEIVIEADLSGQGELASAVWVAGSLLSQRKAPLPAEVASVWEARPSPAAVGGQRLAEAGRKLAGTILDADGQGVLAEVIGRKRPGDTVEVALVAGGDALSLPVELIRLATDSGDIGPIGLLPGISVVRRLASPGRQVGDSPPSAVDRPAGTAGPLKVLAAVAAPDETKTRSAPLDAEAEMQAVLDAVTGLGDQHAQGRILEIASLAEIRRALEQDTFHVLHLSAHGSPKMVELEDEDGAPATVTSQDLMQALQHAGRPVPLIVLSSCSGGSTGSAAMAAGLIARGADRVIAMLASVTDPYATNLARYLYHELSAHPALTTGQALARARYLTEQDRSHARDDHAPAEYGVATLFAADGDSPLTDPNQPEMPLTARNTPPTGKGVRELPLGALIGRRPELRTLMAVLRHADSAVRQFGVAGGAVLTGVGGIGKTALAGRAISRLRDDGWLIAVHEGRWNPTALITATSHAIDQAFANSRNSQQAAGLHTARERLADPGSDDGPKLAAVAGLLAASRLLVVFDDFEQNLTTGGQAFLDPALGGIITALADAAETGALLVTCRYPLPATDDLLVPVAVPALSPAELRRLFLRLPALADLNAEDKRLLTRAIGGHPRLIEFTDALLRGGHASLKHIQTRLRGLARAEHLDLSRDPSLGDALDQAMLLGAADILLTELTELLTPRQAQILRQVAVSRQPMTLDDLAFALTPTPGTPDTPKIKPDLAALNSDVDRLADLTLLTTANGIAMHPWTAHLVTRHTTAELGAEHERALAMRVRRFEQDRGSYGDLIDIPRHLAALHRYDDIPGIAEQVVQALPGTLAGLAYLAEIRPLIPATERSWIPVADREVQALLAAGDLPSATRQLQAIHQQVQTRAAADPANTEWQRDLSLSHDNLGDLATATGDLAAARTHYQASLDIRTTLTTADPANTEWQRDLSLSHDNLGDLATATGDLAAARTHYQASLDIRTTLTTADPANTEWQRDLSLSHDNLGDLATATGDLAAARTHYQASLDIITTLATADPANTEWQRDLSLSHDNLGNAATATGDLATARTHYQASLDIITTLTTADPANTEWQRDLSISHDNLGNAATATGDLATARTHYQASLDIRTTLTTADPANTEWQRDLSISHNKLGDLATATGDLATARTHYEASLDIRTTLTTADPANTEWQRDLSVSHNRLGDAATATGNLATARTHYQTDLDIAAHLAAVDPANTEWQRDLSVSHDNLGNAATATGDLAAVRTHYQASLDIRTTLTTADPANTEWQRDLSISHEKLGDAATATGDLTTARTHYQASLDIRTTLTTADPANTGWQRDLSISHNRLGDAAIADGDLTSARTHYQASLDIAARLLKADPTNAGWQADLKYVRERMDGLPDAGQ